MAWHAHRRAAGSLQDYYYTKIVTPLAPGGALCDDDFDSSSEMDVGHFSPSTQHNPTTHIPNPTNP